MVTIFSRWKIELDLQKDFKNLSSKYQKNILTYRRFQDVFVMVGEMGDRSQPVVFHETYLGTMTSSCQLLCMAANLYGILQGREDLGCMVVIVNKYLQNGPERKIK